MCGAWLATHCYPNLPQHGEHMTQPHEPTEAELLTAARTPGVLTPKQLQAVELQLLGYGRKRMGRILGITPQAAAARIDGAMARLYQHHQQKEDA